MAKLQNYTGTIELISGVYPKNGKDFPLMDAHDVQTQEDGTRLDAELETLHQLDSNIDEIVTSKNAATENTRFAIGVAEESMEVPSIEEFNELKDDIDELTQKVSISKESKGTSKVSFAAKAGEVLRITNQSDENTVDFRAKVSADDTSFVHSKTIYKGATVDILLSTDITVIIPYFYGAATLKIENISKRVPVLEEKTNVLDRRVKNLESTKDEINEIFLDSILLEPGTIQTNGTDAVDSGRLRTHDFYTGDIHIVCPDGISVRWCYLYSLDKKFVEYIIINQQEYTVSIPSDRLARFTFMKDSGDAISISDIKRVQTLERFNGRIGALEIEPKRTLSFDYNHDLRDVTSYMAELGYDGNESVRTKTQDAFDAFAGLHPELIKVYDAVEESGQSDSKPDYVYYTTKMYKFDGSVLSGASNRNRGKILLIAGTHGTEPASVVNSYIAMRSLFDGITTDPNAFKLFQNFDIYVLPCLNGWGLDGGSDDRDGVTRPSRYNYNGVSITRNYPNSRWTLQDEPFTWYHNGSSAGSEFETKIVMGLATKIKPDIIIDHHSYGNEDRQFYITTMDDGIKSRMYRSYDDCVFALKKAYPQYFGNAFSVVKGEFPNGFADSFTGWGYENGIKNAILEVSMCINYVNGEYSNSRTDWMGADTLSIAEYTLRNEILRLAEYVSE